MCRPIKRSFRRIQNYRDAPVTYRKSTKRWSQTIKMCFVRMDYSGLFRDFHFILTQIIIHLSDAKPPGTALTSMRL